MFFFPRVSCMAPAFTSPSWVDAHHHLLGSTPAGLVMSFSLRKGKAWDHHKLMVFPHQHCFQQKFLPSFTQVLPGLIPASSESQTLVPCTEPLPHTQLTHGLVCVPRAPPRGIHSSLFSSLQSSHLRGARPDFGCPRLACCCSSYGRTHHSRHD